MQKPKRLDFSNLIAALSDSKFVKKFHNQGDKSGS
jgi:hypothetical protein